MTDTNATTVRIDFDTTFTPKTFEDGEESLLRIASLGLHTSQSGNTSLKVKFEHPTDPTYEDVFEYFSLPQGADREGGEDRKKDNRCKLRLKSLQDCFSIDINSVDMANPEANSAVGAEGYCILAKETDQQYGDRNRIKTFTVTR